ncbi:DUF1801 domain-containing protein [Flavobacterium nackdongense]|uniref:DUF1801 domain-containing protein n=1 Tax=Flavobacterium nackdongense TaxID=2547394 RepID=A0A4P6Y751_9FLAO|nr:DUF1801 domain-containing protein [Flavobacterium nackdongense]QBN17348.1 DUF1801 domain-containing protein [Flavobacterium nackdongense]
MISTAKTVEMYLNELPEDRKEPFLKLRTCILNSLPQGFQEEISYGMLGYVVPHSLYPNGYHCNPKLPLPFLSIASQKNFVAIYHMGLYTDPELMHWFITEFAKNSKHKLDMGKSCIRFKKLDQIPFDLIAELAAKMSVTDWINCYELSKI